MSRHDVHTHGEHRAADTLALREVTVAYGDTVVLDHLDLVVPARSGRSITVLLGPSGCGKSTLIRAVAGLEPLTGGTITFDGADLSSIPVHRRDFGVVFQDHQIFAGRSVFDNVAYGLRMRRVPRAEIAARVAEVLDLVKLSGRERDSVQNLSGGQAQRVALARALAPRPRLLLLDEPLSSLDRRLREELAEDLAEIIAAARTPAVMVTHDHDEAAALGDAVAVMREGRIEQVGAPSRLWRSPRNDWVARFLGATDIVDVEVSGPRVCGDLGDLSVLAAGEGGTLTRTDITLTDGPHRLALRPESLVVEAARPGEPGAGEVVASVSLPGRHRVRVRLDATGTGTHSQAATGLRELRGVSAADLAVGTRVRLRLDPAAVALVGEDQGGGAVA